MLNFKKKLAEWRVSSPGDITLNKGEGGGSKSSWIEACIPEFESTRERWNTLWSVWKPAWYTGWHAGVLASATSAVVILIINISLTIYAATNREYEMQGGFGTLYFGSCDKSKKIGMSLRLVINFLSTLLLSASNYTQQCLASPTRSEVDAAHARRRWMDIGVPSVRNLFRIKRERALLWIAIGITSVPLHFLYNSAVYTALAQNDYFITTVTNNHFERRSHSNLTEALFELYQEAHNVTDWSEYNIDFFEIPLRSSVLKGYDTNSQSYEDLTPAECTKVYNTEFMSGHRNLYLITNHSSNATHNSAILGMTRFRSRIISPRNWMCFEKSRSEVQVPYDTLCNPDKIASDVAKGLPWRWGVLGNIDVEISGCKSEKTPEKCKVNLSLGIMIVVICCNLVNACSMIMAFVRSCEPTLVTLGDAVDSFLRSPDQETIGMCFAGQRFIKRGWRNGLRTLPGQWKDKEAQRWWTSVSKTSWGTFNILCLTAIITAGWLLQTGMAKGGYFHTDTISMWAGGFGNVNRISPVALDFRNITQTTLIANLPQIIPSFLYLTYNSLFTCMLLGHEWSLFGHHHRTLRVTSPGPGQRSTYWLQIPYTYAIPLMTLSGLLHWLTSQSIFLARVEIWNPLGEISGKISGVWYSCIAMIFALILVALSLLTAAGMGYRPFAAEIVTVGSCSAAISAACHTWGEDSEAITGKKLRWGDVGIVPNLGVRHLTFSSNEGVGKPVFGEVYAGTESMIPLSRTAPFLSTDHWEN